MVARGAMMTGEEIIDNMPDGFVWGIHPWGVHDQYSEARHFRKINITMWLPCFNNAVKPFSYY